MSVAGGYQYADSEQMGPAVVIITNNDRDLAEREAKRLSDMLWATRDQLKLNLPDPAAAVREALTATKFPVALIDMGDNIGGGSSGDGTFLLEQLIAQKADGWVVVIADPAAVQAAVKAGIGGAFDMPVGGKTDQFHGKPVRVRGRVKSLHDGNYIETESPPRRRTVLEHGVDGGDRGPGFYSRYEEPAGGDRRPFQPQQHSPTGELRDLSRAPEIHHRKRRDCARGRLTSRSPPGSSMWIRRG